MARPFLLALLVGCGSDQIIADLDTDPDTGPDTDLGTDIDVDTDTDLGTEALGCEPALAPFGGGDGTSANPYTICSVTHLDSVRTAPGDHFAMRADVDLSATTFAPLPVFSGVFDGAGHTIRGFTHTATSATAPGVALFDRVEGGQIHDLVIADADLVVPQYSSVAVRVVDGGGVVERLEVRDAVLHGLDGFLGGVFHMVTPDGTVSDIRFSGVITSAGTTGFIGGVMGACRGTCTRIVAEGSVDGGAGWKVGGITNEHRGTLSGCASHMAVSGGSRVGGVAAVHVDGVIEDCLVDGSVSGVHWVGGVAGESYGGTDPILRRSVVVAPLSASTSHAGVSVGGLVAWDPSPVDVIASAWSTDATGTTTSAGGVGLTTAQLQDPTLDLFATWGAPWVLQAGQLPTLDFD